jgi:Fic family protein
MAQIANNLTSIKVSHETLGLIAEIDEFKGRWGALQTLSRERLLALRRVATIESVGSSTRIEGAKLTDREIEMLLSRVRRRSFRSRDEQEVAGYAAAMDLVFQAWEDLSLTENHIKQLHSVLLKYSARDEHHRGQYKRAPNNVVAYGHQGREIGVIFETASPFKTPLEMEKLLRDTNLALTEGAPHPLIVTAAFALRFLAVHPFQDGNGRLSRILTTLLLLRAGYAYVPYCSLEGVIEENKDLYYAALRRTQVSLKREKPAWEPWIIFFLRCLKKQKDRLVAKIEREKILAPALPKLSIRILSLLKEHERLTSNELRRLTRANQNTLKVRLRELVNSGRVSRHGKARATWYALASGD